MASIYTGEYGRHNILETSMSEKKTTKNTNGDLKSTISAFSSRVTVSEEAMCGYCRLFINEKCALGHKSVNSYLNCQDLIPID